RAAIEPLVTAALSDHTRLQRLLQMDGPTAELARQMLKARLGEFTIAPWGLVRGPDDMATYEAIAEKFPKDHSPDRVRADREYLQGLAMAGRIPEAIALYKQSASDQSHPDFGAEAFAMGMRFGHNQTLSAAAASNLTKFYSEVASILPSPMI